MACSTAQRAGLFFRLFLGLARKLSGLTAGPAKDQFLGLDPTRQRPSRLKRASRFNSRSPRRVYRTAQVPFTGGAVGLLTRQNLRFLALSPKQLNPQPSRVAARASAWWLIAGLLSICWFAVGCRRYAPIHVWQPPQTAVTYPGRIALAPIAGDRELAQQIQAALMAQRPQARADMAVFTAEQLLESSAVQLASTAPLTSDILAIQAARAAGANILLQGEILGGHIDLTSDAPSPQPVNMNQAFFHKPKDKLVDPENILLSWRVIDVATSKTIGTSTFNLSTQAAMKQYPDLDFIQNDASQMLVAASARETWKTISPYVVKDEVRLAAPWLQPGAFTVWRGVRAARKGNWELAEQRWQRTADLFGFNASAQHNLAVAYAAREDFPAAKEQLQKATGLFAFRLPPETLYWLDQRHRLYNTAHGLDRPDEGWAFPEPDPSEQDVASVPTVDVASLPWWTALPMAKPPGWTWKGWLTQPWAL